MHATMNLILRVLFVGALAVPFQTASANTTCEKSSMHKKAAAKLLRRFKDVGHMAAKSAAFELSIENINGDGVCGQGWIRETLALPAVANRFEESCGVVVKFKSRQNLEDFARATLMLTVDSQSGVMVIVRGAFSSPDPHDPSGNTQPLLVDVPYCAVLSPDQKSQ